MIIVFVEGALRPGYDAMYHTVSELCLGERAWVQVTNFAQMEVGMVILAAGVNQALDSSIASILLGLFGLGLVGAAIFRPDPMRGYPPDAPRVVASEQSRHAKIHDVLGGPIFLALFLAVLLVAFDLEDGWRAYTFATAGAGLALTITTAISLQRDAFSACVPIHMQRHDGQHIADGLAKAMLRDAADTAVIDEEEYEKETGLPPGGNGMRLSIWKASPHD